MWMNTFANLQLFAKVTFLKVPLNKNKTVSLVSHLLNTILLNSNKEEGNTFVILIINTTQVTPK